MADSSSPLPQVRSVCVFCGSSNTTKPAYLDLATRFGAALGFFADRLEDRVANLRPGGRGKAERCPEAGEAKKGWKRARGVAACQNVDAVSEHERRDDGKDFANEGQQKRRSEAQPHAGAIQSANQSKQLRDGARQRRRDIGGWFRLRHCPAFTTRHLEQSLRAPLKVGEFSPQCRLIG